MIRDAEGNETEFLVGDTVFVNFLDRGMESHEIMPCRLDSIVWLEGCDARGDGTDKSRGCSRPTVEAISGGR